MRYYLLALMALTLISQKSEAQISYKLFNIHPHADSGCMPDNFTVFNNKVYFFAYEPVHGRELWVSDGDTAMLAVDVLPGPFAGCLYSGRTEYYRMAATSEYLYFAGKDTMGIHCLYQSSGTGTPHLLYKTNDNSFLGIKQILAINNKVYFFTPVAAKGYQILVYDQMTNQITPLPIDPNADITDFTKLFYWPPHNRLYFNALDINQKFNADFFYYDLNTGTTHPIKNNERLAYMLNPKGLNNHFFFKDYVSKDLYECDVNSNIRVVTKDVHIQGGTSPYLQDSYDDFCMMNDIVFFCAKDLSTKKPAIYKYDPKNGSKIFVHALQNDSAARAMMSHKNKLYFHNAGKIWVTDLKNPPYTLQSKYPSLPFNFCNNSYFTEHNGKLFGTVHIKGSGEFYNHEFIVLYDSVTSVEKTKDEFIAATLYPNPTDKDAYLTIKLPQAQNLQVSVTDMNGRVVYSTQQKLYSAGSHNIPLHTQQLPAGNYIYTIRNEENTLLQSGKMVKQ